MTTFTNNSIFTKEGKVEVDIYKMQVMTIGMSKLVVGEADSPIRCDVVLHQEDGHFDDFCFIYHMAHDLKSTVKYNEEIERIKRIMDSSAQFNVYINPVEFIENCTRCLENAPTNRYTKTVYSGTSIESMRYFVQLVADSDENLISEAHAMVARFIESLKGTVFLQSVASQLEFKISDATTYQRELLVGDRFRDFMAGLKGYVFKGSQDEVREKIREVTPVFNNVKSFPFCINEETRNDYYTAIYVNDDNDVEVTGVFNGKIGDSEEMDLDSFIEYIVDKTHYDKYIASRNTIIAIAKHFFANQDFEPKENQLKDYYKFIDWMKNTRVIANIHKRIENTMDLVREYNRDNKSALVITKRGEGLKSNYDSDYKCVECAVEDEFNISNITDIINKEKSYIVFIDSNLGKTVKEITIELLKILNAYERNHRGWRKPKVCIETATHFWINMFDYCYLSSENE